MSFVVKSYEPDKGFEEIQAKIYNEAVAKYTGTKVTAENIKIRIEQEKPDFKGIRYAFNEKNEPLAYIQYRLYPGNPETLYIGYPWACDNCPNDVQERLYSDLFNYVKKKYPDQDLYLGYISDSFVKMHEFAKEKGFEKNDFFATYRMNVEKASNFEFKSFLETKIVTDDDLSALVELVLDSNLGSSMNEEQLTKYFTEKVLKDGNCVVISKDGKFIGATAPLRTFDPEITMIRFTALRKGHESHFKSLYGALARRCKELGWTDRPLSFSASNENENMTNLAESDDLVVHSKSSQFKLPKKLKEY